MIVSSSFRPCRWLRGPHWQTVWPYLFRLRRKLLLRRERLELPDGDFVDLEWLTGSPDKAPLVVIFHGLEGSSRSHYARGLMQACQSRQLGMVLMHFRNCSDEPNRLARSYHSGETGDIGFLLDELGARFPDRILFAVGYSLGGNALLKYLGERGDDTPLRAAVAISVPLELAKAAHRMRHGLSRLYQWRLIRQMKAAYRRKFSNRSDGPVPLSKLDELRDFFRYDNDITAPLHGFADVHDYYARCSSRQWLHKITRSTLILQARDDPFMTASVIPREDELSSAVDLEVSEHGGHVGFVSGTLPWRLHYWLDERIMAYFASHT